MNKQDKYYAVTGHVDTIIIRTEEWGEMNGLCLIPEFYVRAASRGKAEKLAREIIDPLQMTGSHITVRKLKKGPPK